MEVIGNVISGAKELYDSTNKANLSGAIDVVVVKQVSTVLWLQHSIHPNRFIFDFVSQPIIGANLLATGSTFPFFFPFILVPATRLDWMHATL